MRDVVTGFYCDVLRQLIARGEISTADSVLVVCGGPLDEAVMREVGFARFVISGLDGSAAQQDAERLSFADGAFDVVIAHAGLHHCYSPHRALLEMYRVARKAAIAFEAFVYRWTEREVWKAIATFDPRRKPRIEFFYDLRIPVQRYARSGNHALRLFGTVIEPLSRVFAAVLPSQCNEFAFAISKSGELHPWTGAGEKQA
jgi:SAM-dependent methyltransferase